MPSIFTVSKKENLKIGTKLDNTLHLVTSDFLVLFMYLLSALDNHCLHFYVLNSLADTYENNY
jgi:hypothetical protein